MGAGPPLPPILNQGARRPVTEALNEAAEKTGGAGGTLNGTKKLLDDAIDAPNIRKNAANIRLFEQRFGQLSRILGDQFDDEVAENFVKIYDHKIISSTEPGADWFEQFILAFEGNSSRFTKKIDALSPGAKEALIHFLKGPNPGDIWKLDSFVSPPQFGAVIRGILAEEDLARNVYEDWQRVGLKKAGFEEDVDFFKDSIWVQEKTANSASASQISKHKNAITSLVTYIEQNGGSGLYDLRVKEGLENSFGSLETYIQGLQQAGKNIAIDINTYHF